MVQEFEDVRDDHGEWYSERPPFGECEGTFRGCEGVGERVFDPYSSDVNNVREWVYLCEHCYGEASAEI